MNAGTGPACCPWVMLLTGCSTRWVGDVPTRFEKTTLPAPSGTDEPGQTPKLVLPGSAASDRRFSRLGKIEKESRQGGMAWLAHARKKRPHPEGVGPRQKRLGTGFLGVYPSSWSTFWACWLASVSTVVPEL